MPIEFVKASAFELEGLPRQKTVFFFPVGPLEDHGPHLPVGLDLEEADRLCFLAAQHLEEEMPGWVGVVMPKAPLGIDSNTTRLAITVRSHVLRDWLVDACRSLIRLGFFHFVCFSGHLGPRQLTAIEDAGRIITQAGRWTRIGKLLRGMGDPRVSLISASSALVPKGEVLRAPFWPDPAEHGGRRDTSVALAIAKNRVDDHYRALPTQDKNSSKWLRNLNRRRRQLSGYWGSPALADADQGEAEILRVLEDSFLKMRAVWDGTHPQWLFRSWYSILPPNKSFFKAWLLVVAVVVMLVVITLLHSFSFQIE